MPNAIDISNLSKTFFSRSSPWGKKKATIVLSDVNLSLKEGECLALLGPNGAGKTTLIKILCSLILPDSGEIKIAGYNINSQGELNKSKIGLVTGEERSFYWRLTGRQNLDFFATLYSLHPQMIKQRIRELTDLLEIEELDKPFFNYSTGTKHRLSIARCLIHNPGIIFMDEPTKSLDIESTNKFRNFIKEKLIKEMQKTILFVTHQAQEAEQLADRCAIIDKGGIKICGTPNEIKLKFPSHTLEDAYLKITGEN